MVSRTQGNALARVNARIVDAVRADLNAFWARLDLTRPEGARDALIEFVAALTEVYGQVAAVAAAEWYDEVRAAAVVRDGFRARPATPVPVEQANASARFAAGHLFTGDPAGALAVVGGALQRLVLQPGRATITENTDRDPQASGWRRVAREGGCRFCVMLAQRGAVYKKASVDFGAHDGCNCAAAPSWDSTAPEVDVRAYTASQRTTAMTPAQREAHNTRVRQWMDAHEDDLDAFRAQAGI